MGHLVAPGAHGEFIAALAGGAKERAPDLVDGEGVGLEWSRSLAWVEELSAILDPVGDRLGELGAVLGQIPGAKCTAANAGEADEALGFELGEDSLHPASGSMRRMDLPELCCGEEPMLIERVQHVARH